MPQNRTNAARTALNASRQMEGSEVYELLVAELEGRRERLRDLLRLVTMEAKRSARKPISAPARPGCRRTAPRTA
jgi:hypothetical protein